MKDSRNKKLAILIAILLNVSMAASLTQLPNSSAQGIATNMLLAPGKGFGHQRKREYYLSIRFSAATLLLFLS